MAILDLTAMNAALKELYDGQVVENLVYADNPAFAMIPKKTDFGGKYKPIPIQTGVSQGRSATFSNAQGNQSAAEIESFFLTRVSDYSIADIDNQTMLASATDKMSFLEGAKLLIDSAIRSITLSAASAMYRSGTGSIGQISTIGSVGTGVIQLSNVNDIVFFENNMTLQANATDGGTPRAALGYVIAVNRSLGQLTVSAVSQGGAAGAPSGWIANDYLLVQGDVNAKMAGFAAWVPASAPSATTFFGVDRTSDVTRLGGLRYDGSDQSIEEALIDASSLAAREGAKLTHYFVNFASYSALEKALGSKVQYIDLKANAEVAFRGIQINGPTGVIRVIPDRNCIPQTAFGLQMNTWALNSLGECPMILRYGDGLEMLRLSSSDAAEVRVGYYANVSCNAPGWNINVALSA